MTAIETKIISPSIPNEANRSDLIIQKQGKGWVVIKITDEKSQPKTEKWEYVSLQLAVKRHSDEIKRLLGF